MACSVSEGPDQLLWTVAGQTDFEATAGQCDVSESTVTV